MTDTLPVVLVHGFWGGAAHWTKVVLDLHRRGYADLHAVELTLNSLADDADRVRQQLGRLGRPALLVGHSYGGAVITEAGTDDNAAGLVYVAAFAPDAGQSVGAISSTGQPATAAQNVTLEPDGRLWLPQATFRESFAQDLPEDEAYVMAVTQKAPPATTFADTVTTPAWRHRPSWYQVSTQDRMIHPDTEREMARRMGPRQVLELDASHASLASRSTEITDLIDHAATTLQNAG